MTITGVNFEISKNLFQRRYNMLLSYQNIISELINVKKN